MKTRKLLFSFAAIATLASAALSSIASAGALPSRRIINDRVGAKQSAVYFITFTGGPADIFVAGDGATDLDLYVDDSVMQVVGDSGPTHICHVWWSSPQTRTYRVVVVNRGLVPSDFVLRTN